MGSDTTSQGSAIARFEKPFTQQESLPETAISAVERVMRSGRLHRYNTAADELSEVDQLEREFARYQGAPYCLACASGGYAMYLALLASGVKAGDKVLCNAYTLAPVPGAIHNAGAQIVYVEVDQDLCIDLDDLERQARSTRARFLLLSHMRGHLADMNLIVDICNRHNIALIEDCAHTMGASWDGVRSGNFGQVACFSTQTYKHINSGEGGLLTCAAPEVMARAVLLSGSYMLFDQHVVAPAPEVYEELRYLVPNYSGRMDNLRAAALRPQLAQLDAQCARWNIRYGLLEDRLRVSGDIRLMQRSPGEAFVGSSIQFALPRFGPEQMQQVVGQCGALGVVLKWFGAPQPKGYTSRYDSWRYAGVVPELAQTDRVLATLLDMRIPLTFDEMDCEHIADIIIYVVSGLGRQHASSQ